MPAIANPRLKVLWFGPPPNNAVLSEFTNRHLSVEANIEKPLSELRFSSAAVFKFDPSKPNNLLTHMNAYLVPAINNGLFIMAISDNDKGQINISEALNLLNRSKSVIQRTNPPLSEVAERSARHDPGPGENPELSLKGEDIDKLSDVQKLFLRRAFWDCKEVLVNGLDGGRSANVFRVFATFRDSLVGPRPLPFFVKIDAKHKILSELKNYKTYTEHFIPFSSRPNLDHSRCFVGAVEGLIVGNFVEQSESLWDLAIRGHAANAIFSLFDEALRGWRLQAYQRGDLGLLKQNVYRGIGDIFWAVRVSKHRLEKAFELGATLLPKQIREFARSMPEIVYRTAPIHGDLHAKNVRVRNSDAILIDFNSTRPGPIVADPASLEVALVFSAGKDDDNIGWQKMVDTLFESRYFEQAPSPATQPLPREWLWNCVRQIRLFALSMQTTRFEYAAALGVYLLRFSMFKADHAAEEFRRAYAYVLAENLLKMAAKAHATEAK
jgi:hypothetical protein